MGANLNLGYLTRKYFYWDEPVPYQIDNKHDILIYPILLKDSEIFLNSIGLFEIEKNEIPNPEIITMSYLEFMVKHLFQDEINKYRLVNLFNYCLHMKIDIFQDDFGKYKIIDETGDIIISSKKFDEIRKIILHQNFYDYEDDYIDPELKQAMNETDSFKRQNIAEINIERKMAIISAHTGISKNEQSKMTYRAHSILFREVCGEVDMNNTWMLALYKGQANKIDHWIFRKKKGKLDDYITNAKKFTESVGGNIHSTSQSVILGDVYDGMYAKFNK